MSLLPLLLLLCTPALPLLLLAATAASGSGVVLGWELSSEDCTDSSSFNCTVVAVPAIAAAATSVAGSAGWDSQWLPRIPLKSLQTALPHKAHSRCQHA